MVVYKKLLSSVRRILLWQKNSLKIFVKYLLESQKHYMQADFYVKQLCLFLYSRQLITKNEVHHYYTFFTIKRKNNLYYAFFSFKKNTRLFLLRRVATYTRLLKTNINIKQRCALFNLIHLFDNYLLSIDSASFYNNNSVLSLFTYIRSMLNFSETKFILIKQLKYLKTQLHFKQYLTFH